MVPSQAAAASQARNHWTNDSPSVHVGKVQGKGFNDDET